MIYLVWRHRFIASWLVIGCIAAFGCKADSERIDVYAVSGKVLAKGQPAAGARVVFYSTTAEVDGKRMPTPAGEAGADGVFHLDSYEHQDGAPAGDYKVAITWLEPPPANATGIFDVKDRLANKYSNPDKSGLTAHVDEGGGEIPVFDLK